MSTYRHRSVLSYPLSTIQLHALIDDPLNGRRDENLRLSDRALAGLVPQQVHCVCGGHDDEAHGIQFKPHLGDSLNIGIEFADELSSGLEPGILTTDHTQFIGPFALPNQSTCVSNVMFRVGVFVTSCNGGFSQAPIFPVRSQRLFLRHFRDTTGRMYRD